MQQVPQVQESASSLAQMFTEAQVDLSSGGSFLKFDAKGCGEWLLGTDKEPVTDDVVAIDITSLQHGQMQFHNGQCLKALVPLNEKAPQPFEPKVNEKKTAAARKKNPDAVEYDHSMDARVIAGCFVNEVPFTFETYTQGGVEAVNGLIGSIIGRARANNPYIIPHVKLDTTSYEHSTYGTITKPVLTPVAWFDEYGNQEGEETPMLDAQDSAPEPEPEPEPEPTPAPKRQRRQRKTV